MAKVVDSAVAWINKIECVCDRWNKHTVMDCLAIWDGELVPVNDGGGHFSRRDKPEQRKSARDRITFNVNYKVVPKTSFVLFSGMRSERMIASRDWKLPL